MRVFISHSTRDRSYVEREIIALLSANGIDTWYCKDDIRTADEWERTIFKGLESCEWFLLAMSVHSAASEWVKDEVHWAIDERPNRIVPVRIGECKPRDFHIRLGRIQYVDFLLDLEEGKRRLLQVWQSERVPATPAPSATPAMKPESAPSRPPKLDVRHTPSAPVGPLPGQLPQNLGWYFSEDGKSISVITSLAYIQGQTRVGQIDPNALVWREGLPGWIPIQSVVGVSLAGVQPARTQPPPLAKSIPELHRFEGLPGAVTALALSPDGRVAAAGCRNGSVRLCDLTTRGVRSAPPGHTKAIGSISFVPDGVHILTSSADQSVRIVDWIAGREVRCFTPKTNWAAALASPQLAASGSPVGNAVMLWNPQNGQELRRLEGHTEPVRMLAFNGSRLITTGRDQTVRIWDLDKYALQRTLTVPKIWLGSIAPHPDRRHLVTCHEAGVSIWDLETGAEIARLQGHNDDVLAVVVSFDGRRLVSGSVDGTVRVWDSLSGQEIACAVGHAAEVTGVAITADGRFAVSGSEDRTLRVWQMPDGA